MGINCGNSKRLSKFSVLVSFGVCAHCKEVVVNLYPAQIVAGPAIGAAIGSNP